MRTNKTIWIVADDLKKVKPVDATVEDNGIAHVAVMHGTVPGLKTYMPHDWHETEEDAKVWQAICVFAKLNAARKVLLDYEDVAGRLREEFRHLSSDDMPALFRL